MQKRVVLKIYGRVQGMSFRDSTRRKANKLGIFGFARNEEDGSVFILAEGEENKISELIKLVNKGPIFSKVDKVEVNYEEFKGEFHDFRIA